MNKVLITFFTKNPEATVSGNGVGATHIILFDTLEHLYQRIEREMYMNSLLTLPEGDFIGFIIHPATEEDVYEKSVIWAFGEEVTND